MRLENSWHLHIRQYNIYMTWYDIMPAHQGHKINVLLINNNDYIPIKFPYTHNRLICSGCFQSKNSSRSNIFRMPFKDISYK